MALAIVLAVYLVGRGVAEFFVIDYSNPASYASDWGDPSLIGVLTVHSGPAIAIVTAVIFRLRRGGRSGG
jgi:hypothetical protein